MKRFIPILFFVLTLIASPTWSDVFQNGQTVCFYGDSITHGGRFHYYIFDYYVTRYPQNVVEFHNSGVGGDTAGACQNRMDEDVTRFQPDAVVLMFGMNDVGRGNFSATPSENQIAAQQRAREGYTANMSRLATTLREKLPDSHLIFITPSPFDHTGLNDRNNNNVGCNDGLARFAEIVKSQAATCPNSELVDFHGPMTALNLEHQKHDPYFTIVGPDRVHPAGPGHLMMAWLFLKSQGAPSCVSNVTLNANTGTIQKSDNAQISDLRASTKGLSFTIFENALPFPIEPDALPGTAWFPVIEDLNQELFSVVGLEPGHYTLNIDGNPVGTWTSEELATGVNLAMNDQTPQYQQAQTVRRLGTERRAVDLQLRSFAAVRWFLRLRNVNPDDLPAVADFAENRMSPKTGYFENMVPGYLEKWTTHPELEQELESRTQKMYSAAQPRAHHYELISVQGN